MSDTQSKPRTFLDLFLNGRATASDADDWVTAWHDSGDAEPRTLAAYLGMTDDEYDVWTMDPRTLSVITAARHPAGPGLLAAIGDYVIRMQARKDPTEHGTVLSFRYWLEARGFDR